MNNLEKNMIEILTVLKQGRPCLVTIVDIN